jgi:hypothetical protein
MTDGRRSRRKKDGQVLISLTAMFRSGFLSACCIVAITCDVVSADGLEKLKAERLEAVRLSVEVVRSQRVEVPRTDGYQEHRANLHVHSHWSHDSVGTIEEIVAAAKRTGTSVVMFSEHPADHYDFFIDGHRGLRDGVLLIPGAEMNGFLAYPTLSLRGVTPKSPQELSDLILGRDGQAFVSHPEERMDWEIQGVTGMEIYNTHADFKDEKNMISALKNPFRMIQLSELIRKYPQECFASLQNYPTDYLKRWDQLCMKAPHTGVSANDAHQNVGFVIRWIEGEKGQLEDALGEKLIEMDLAFLPDSENLRKDKKPGDPIFSMYLDRYENSLRHVATHLLLKEQSEQSVRECLEAGRAFVAFDWMADSTGFDFFATTKTTRHTMGSEFEFAEPLQLQAIAPLPVHWKLFRNGTVVAESDGREASFAANSDGVYRCEAWLEIAGEPMLWILSNPIYVRPEM